MTLPYEEVVNGQDGTIVHWDIRKDTNSEISDFAIFNDQNNRIDHNSDNSLNDILSLRNVAKSASGGGRGLKGSSDPSHFIFEINVGKSRIRYRTTPNFE